MTRLRLDPGPLRTEGEARRAEARRARPVALPRRWPGIDQAHPRYLLPLDDLSGELVYGAPIEALQAADRFQWRWGGHSIDWGVRLGHATWLRARSATPPPEVQAWHAAEVDHHDAALMAYLAAQEGLRA